MLVTFTLLPAQSPAVSAARVPAVTTQETRHMLLTSNSPPSPASSDPYTAANIKQEHSENHSTLALSFSKGSLQETGNFAPKQGVTKLHPQRWRTSVQMSDGDNQKNCDRIPKDRLIFFLPVCDDVQMLSCEYRARTSPLHYNYKQRAVVVLLHRHDTNTANNNPSPLPASLNIRPLPCLLGCLAAFHVGKFVMCIYRYDENYTVF